MFNGYPYQHLELNDLPGEKWKWIPWLEGYYKISSFGRVKREGFEIEMVNGTQRVVQEKILAGELQKFPNRYIGDQVYHLRVRVMKDGIKYPISLARVTYYCFKKKFDLEDMDRLVLALDGDGRNIRLDNIVLVNRSKKQQRIFDRKRFKKPVVYSFDEFSDGLQKSANENCRQVSQYTMTGKKLKTFLSIKAAAVFLNLSESGINSALKERQVSSGGFVWRYGTASKVDLKPFLEKRATHRKLLRGTKVSQYDTNGKRLNTYLTFSDAGAATGIRSSDICVTANGKQKSAGGYIWRKGWGKLQINVRQDSYGEILRAKVRWKKVKQYSLEGKYLKTFESVKAAAESVKVLPSAISAALKSKSNIGGGYKWKVMLQK